MSKETNKKLSPEQITELREENIRSLQKQIIYLKVLHEHDKLKSEIADGPKVMDWVNSASGTLI